MLVLAHLHWPVLTLPRLNYKGSPPHQACWNLAITSPQFRPPSFQGKTFFRQALAKLGPNLAKLSRKICLYFLHNGIVRQILDSQNAQGPDFVGRTKVSVFLVAMAILPILQNMLRNIGTGHYIHVYVYITFHKNFSNNKTIH